MSAFRKASSVALVVLVAALWGASGQADLVGYWNFEGNANDSSAAGLNGTLFGDAGYSATVPTQIGAGSSLSLDGSGDYMQVDVTAGSVSGSYTVSSWVNVADNTTNAFFSTRAPSDLSFDAKLMGGGGGGAMVHGDIGNGSSWITTSANAALNYATGTWYHVAYVVQPTGYQVFVDGSLKGSGSYGAAAPLLYDPTHDIRIGRVDGGGGEDFGGLIDEVAVWNTALSPSQVAGLAMGMLPNALLVEKPISIFSTGVDADSLVLAPGSADPHWLLTQSPQSTPPPPDIAATVIQNHPAWMANNPAGASGSSWIGPVNPGTTNVAPGGYVYQTTFELPAGALPETAALSLRLLIDDTVTDVRLNGASTGITASGFTSWSSPFVISSGFLRGLNTLEVYALNGGASPNPAGLRIDIRGGALVPEPTTLTLLGLGGLLLARRRRRAR